ncbi:MAG TPA: immunoglobulin domain-containing protein [Verrucomicrobiae bacterium]|nr:immunoglobulin domain-containing protein [Verrucomicrobiae bacterium]
MKPLIMIVLLLAANAAFADELPFITVQPTNQIVSPGNSATLTVAAGSATGFQWRFNGADIAGGTNSTLQIPNAQTNNAGYYTVVAKNSTGWVPSQSAWLSVVPNTPPPPPLGYGGVVPFSNTTNTGLFAQARSSVDGGVINNGNAQVVAGPALDQMQPVGLSTAVSNGYYGRPFVTRTVPTVAPGQSVFYRVNITYTNIYSFSTLTQQSAVLNLVAGGGVYPVPSTGYLKFPAWPEWPEPVFLISGGGGVLNGLASTPTNQVRIPGERFSLTNLFWGFGDFGVPTWQWRKDGNTIGSPQNFTGGITSEYGIAILTITNVQPSDAGIYDVVVLGNDWIVGPKTFVSIQITNGCGVFQSPRLRGTNFVCDLLGAAGRNYKIQCSTNLTVWNDIVTLSNTTGMVAFSNSPAPGGAQFYRTVLLP